MKQVVQIRLEAHHPNPDALSKSELQDLLSQINPPCPNCSSQDWSEVEAMYLMFSTTIGAGASGRDGFMRPETAQGMFTSFPALYRHFGNDFLLELFKLERVSK